MKKIFSILCVLLFTLVSMTTQAFSFEKDTGQQIEIVDQNVDYTIEIMTILEIPKAITPYPDISHDAILYNYTTEATFEIEDRTLEPAIIDDWPVSLGNQLYKNAEYQTIKNRSLLLVQLE